MSCKQAQHSLRTTYYHFKAMHLYWAICLNVSRWHDFMELMLLPALFPCSPILRTIVLQISKLLFKSFTAHSCLLNAGKKNSPRMMSIFFIADMLTISQQTCRCSVLMILSPVVFWAICLESSASFYAHNCSLLSR